MADFSQSAAQVRCYSGVSVTVPSITDPDDAHVDVTVTGVKLGDVVIASPSQALPTNCLYNNAYATADDTVRFTFSSEGGNVTGAAKTFNVQVYEKS
jgi:hypothetical protein